MDGLHDLGGKQGFGRVKYPSAPHNESWRPLVRGLHAFAIESHIYNMDEFRHAIERMTPRHYISAPYFERHLTAIATQPEECMTQVNLRSHNPRPTHPAPAAPWRASSSRALESGAGRP